MLPECKTFEHNGRTLTAVGTVCGNDDAPEMSVDIFDGADLVAQIDEAASVDTIVDWFIEMDNASAPVRD